MKICIATAAHAEEIALLFQEQAAAMAVLQPVTFHAVPFDPEYVLASLARDDMDILLAVDAGHVLGLAQLREAETPSFAGMTQYRYAHLLDLYVREEARGKSVGTALLTAAKEWALARSLSYVELQVLPENTAAIAFYKSRNFNPSMLSVRSFV